jgi:hypothetical protein
MDAQPGQFYNWTGSLFSLGSTNVTLPTYSLTSGTHTFVVYTSNPNSSPDQNTQNDTIKNIFSILPNPTIVQAPLQEGFVPATFAPASWLLENSDNIWSRTTAAGGYGLSSESAKADFYNNSSGTDILVSPFVDFQTLSAPIRLYFDVAYNQFDPTYSDSLIVDLFDDCSGTSTVVYKKGGMILSTATASTASFIPNSSQWRTDSVNLDSKAGQAPLRFRFKAKSDNGNNLYLDNINLTGKLVGVPQLSDPQSLLLVYPNPSNGIFQVKLAGFKIQSLEIYDVLGEKVFSGPGISQFTDITSRPNGIYFLKVKTDRGEATQKIIVQH